MVGLKFLSLKRFSILFLSLLLMNIGAVSASLIGTPFRIARSSSQEVQPSVAYNSQDREYLVVWTDLHADDSIRGQRVAPDGRLIDSPFTIAWTSGHNKSDPDVVYNVKHNQYLVVFSDTYESSPSKEKTIRGRRLGGKGALLDTMDLYIQNVESGKSFGHPAVEYAYTSDRYLVAWDAWDTQILGTYDVFGRIVKPDGSFPSSRFSIAVNSIWPRQRPALAYNRQMNQTMAVWEQYDNTKSKWIIQGRQVTGDGFALPATLTLKWDGDDNRNPDIAALPNSSTDVKFMAVWEINPGSTPNGTASAMINETGIVKWSAKATDSNSIIRSVAVAANEKTKTYLEVSWYDGSVGKGFDVQQHDEDGYVIGWHDLIPGNAGDHPVITAGPLGDYLIVWQDMPSGQLHTDVFGQLVGIRNYIPLVFR